MKSPVGRPRVYGSNAERVAAFRARKGVRRFTVEVDTETYEALKKWLEYKDYTLSTIVKKLIKQQLLRRR